MIVPPRIAMFVIGKCRINDLRVTFAPVYCTHSNLFVLVQVKWNEIEIKPLIKFKY